MGIRDLILFLFTSWMIQKICSLQLELHSTESKLVISCWLNNKELSLDKLEAEMDKTANFTKIYIYNCEPIPYVTLFDALGKTQNEKPKFLHLEEIENLTAEHLIGIDKIGIEMISIFMFKEIKSLHSDIFSSIPSLSKLVLTFKDVFKPIPELSKLSSLQTFSLTISFNPEGREHRKYLEVNIKLFKIVKFLSYSLQKFVQKHFERNTEKT